VFRKSLARSLVGTTALSTAVAASLVAGPSVVATAPEIRHVDNHCTEPYPGRVSTSTDLEVRAPIARFGAQNVVTATVSHTDPAVEGTPDGAVTFTLGDSATWTRPLNANGVASVALPRYLKASATYPVTAAFVAEECSVFGGSSDSGAYTVFRGATSASASVRSRGRGRRPVVDVSVDSALPRDPAGKVRIRVESAGKVRGERVAHLRGGSARAVLRTLQPGRYQVDVRYLGTRNFEPSDVGAGFRIRRGS
jgi:hypothetical protein